MLHARVRFSSLSRARSPISVAPSRAKTRIDIGEAVSTVEGGKLRVESDMMALCFLHEAMAMSRRSVETYARSVEEEEDEEDV